MKGQALQKQTACALNSALSALLTKSSHILKRALAETYSKDSQSHVIMNHLNDFHSIIKQFGNT